MRFFLSHLDQLCKSLTSFKISHQDLREPSGKDLEIDKTYSKEMDLYKQEVSPEKSVQQRKIHL